MVIMKKTIFLILYYGFARYLPPSKHQFCKKIRYVICKRIFAECGKNVNVERMAYFGNGKNVKIGDNSGIGINAHILNNTIIGKDVMMAPNCYMLESLHKIDSTDIPMRWQGNVNKREQVIIEDDVWIGRDVMIIGSKTIKKGSVVGARCLLTKNFPEYSVIGGNPSQLIKSRKQ